MDTENNEEFAPVTELTKPQRRVLGVLVEKAYTTPEYYPLTLKALTTGCNQKSNRSPITQYSEDSVLDTLEELRQLGLVGEVHTDGGRAPRYRHYMRKRFTFTEPQLAIVTELLLRGKQQMGELRSRASRMVRIEGLPQLREELAGLIQSGAAQSSGDLNRRGIDVDHGFYTGSEGKDLGGAAATTQAAPAPTEVAPEESVQAAAPASAAPAAHGADSLAELRATVERLSEMHDQLAEQVARLSSDLDHIARQAGIQT